MKKEVKPGVAAAVIVAVVLVMGVFFYTRSTRLGKPLKPADALKRPGFRDELRKAYEAKYGSH
jgi:hypothetical protein